MTEQIVQPLAPSYDALAVANELIKIARERGTFVIPEQLMLLTYSACGWYVAIHGVALINEAIWAARTGPVIESIEEEFGHYGKTKILELAKYRKGAAPPQSIQLPMMHTNVREIIKTVWDTHGHFTLAELRTLTTKDWGPWSVSRIGVEAGHRVVIHQDVLRRHFFQMAANYRRQRNS